MGLGAAGRRRRRGQGGARAAVGSRAPGGRRSALSAPEPATRTPWATRGVSALGYPSGGAVTSISLHAGISPSRFALVMSEVGWRLSLSGGIPYSVFCVVSPELFARAGRYSII
jgi:hypothetical protein